MAKSSSSNTSIDSLAKSTKSNTKHLTTSLIVFIITLLIIWFILYAFRPVFLQEKDSDGNATGKIQPGKALAFALITALVVAIITYVILSLRK